MGLRETVINIFYRFAHSSGFTFDGESGEFRDEPPESPMYYAQKVLEAVCAHNIAYHTLHT